MNRSGYFNYIEEKLNILSVRVKARGKLNILDFHLHSEDFYMSFLNLLYGFDLKNLNTLNQNVEGIDLIDHTNKLVAQVSATSTKQKIENTLEKDIFNKYKDYKFIFISISEVADDLRKKTYKNKYNVEFLPQNDIYDIPSILRTIIALEIDKQREIYEFIRKELGEDVNIVKLDSDLAELINILSKEPLSNVDSDINIDEFQIDKKIKFNELDSTELIIEDYVIYYGHLNRKYTEFDKLGVNKSVFVLQTIRQQYIKLRSEGNYKNNDILFLQVIEAVKEIIKQSKNYIELSFEQLEFCVNILVVDAFVKCKIFKNPEGYSYVVTR